MFILKSVNIENPDITSIIKRTNSAYGDNLSLLSYPKIKPLNQIDYNSFNISSSDSAIINNNHKIVDGKEIHQLGRSDQLNAESINTFDKISNIVYKSDQFIYSRYRGTNDQYLSRNYNIVSECNIFGKRHIVSGLVLSFFVINDDVVGYIKKDYDVIGGCDMVIFDNIQYPTQLNPIVVNIPNSTSCVQVSGNIFQIAQNGTLYSAKFDYNEKCFYDQNELCSIIPLPTYDEYSLVLFQINKNIFRGNSSNIAPQHLYYEFDNFVTCYQLKYILPKSVMNNRKKQKSNNSIIEQYTNSIVNVKTASGIYGNCAKIADGMNGRYYRVDHTISFDNINESNVIDRFDNANDVHGAFINTFEEYNENPSKENKMILAIDKPESEQTKLSFVVNISNKTVFDFLNNDKFIKLTNTSNKYYLDWCGYKFNSLTELRDNFISIITTNFSSDKIDLSSFTDGNMNYIDGVVGIQTSHPNKTLMAIQGNLESFKVSNKEIIVNRYINSSVVSNSNPSTFQPDYFIDEDGNRIEVNDVSFKLYNINYEMANFIRMVVSSEIEFIDDYANNNSSYCKLDYTIDTIANIESSSYSPNIELEQPMPIGVVEDGSINLSVATNSNTINVNIVDENSVYSSDIPMSDIEFGEGDALSITIDVDDSTLTNPIDKDIQNKNVFSAFDNYDMIDLCFIDNNGQKNQCHIDLLNKTTNQIAHYSSDFDNYLSFGNFPKKCTNQIIANSEYGYNANSNRTMSFYNLAEQCSQLYYSQRFETARSNSYDGDRYLNTFGIGSHGANNVQSPHRWGHTFICNANADDMLDVGYNNLMSSHSGGMCLSIYGSNYGTHVHSPDDSNCNIGITIRPSHTTYSSSISKLVNTNGYNLYNYYTRNDDNPDRNFSFILNRNVDSIGLYGEKTYFNKTNVIGEVKKFNRDSDINPNKPALNVGINSVQYLAYAYNTDNRNGEGIRQKHLIDFDFELNTNELDYIDDNIDIISQKLITEKSKLFTKTKNNADCSGYLYDIPRTKLNIKVLKKYSRLFIYINNIMHGEMETTGDVVNLSNILLFGNKQVGNKTISINKISNMSNKYSGFWC